MDKKEYNATISKINDLRGSNLGVFFNNKKFLESMLFHNLAAFASCSLRDHGNTAPVLDFLKFSGLTGVEYLKAVKWFELRTGKGLVVLDGKLKINKEIAVKEDYSIFKDFMKTYKGSLPTVTSSGKYLDSTTKVVECRDEDDLIGSPLKIGGRNAFGGYGTGKNR